MKPKVESKHVVNLRRVSRVNCERYTEYIEKSSRVRYLFINLAHPPNTHPPHVTLSTYYKYSLPNAPPQQLPSTDPTPSQRPRRRVGPGSFISLAWLVDGLLSSQHRRCASAGALNAVTYHRSCERAFTPQRIEQQPSLPSMPSNFTSISWSLACAFGKYRVQSWIGMWVSSLVIS
jgi:hypothetical protein